MAKLSVVAGATSQTVNILIQNSSSTTGAGLTGLVFNTSGLTAYYTLPRAAATSITLATLAAATSAYASGGFKEIDSVNSPGLYRLDLPNAAIASGRFSTLYLQGATNMAPCVLEIELTGWDNQDATAGGISRIDAAISSRSTYAGADTAGTTTLLTRVPGTVQPQTGDSYARLGAPVTASISADIATRSTYAGADTSGTTTLLSRIAAALTITGGKVDINDKTGFALTAGEHTAIATDAQTGLTAQGYTSTRAGFLDTLSGLVAAIWASGTRTLTAFGFSVTASTVTDKTGYSLSVTPPTVAAIVNGVWDELAASHNTVATMGKLLNSAGGASDPTAIADGLLKRDWTAVTGEPARCLLNALRSVRNNVFITDSGDGTGIITVTKEDDMTVAWTAKVIFDSNGRPISGVDPQ